jgi:hypothetical protein
MDEIIIQDAVVETPAAVEAAPSVESTVKDVQTPVESTPTLSDKTAVNAPESTNAALAKPAWAPSYKFKANGMEHEIPDSYRAFLKSEEEQKKIVRLFERVEGSKKLSEEYEKYKAEYEPKAKELGNYKQSFELFNGLVKEGKFKKAFELFQLPKDVLYKAALENLDFDSLPQEQKQVYDQLNQQERLAAQFQAERETYAAQVQQYKTQALGAELQSSLARPEVKSVQDRFETVYGEGSFRNAIIEAGKQHHKLTGKDASASEVIDQLIGFYKPFMQNQAAAPQANPVDAIVAQTEKPVLPATKGSGNVVKKKVSTVADLEELYRNL